MLVISLLLIGYSEVLRSFLTEGDRFDALNFINYQYSELPDFYNRLLVCLDTGYETCEDRNVLDEILDPLMKDHGHINKVIGMVHGNRGDQWPMVRMCNPGALEDLLTLKSGEMLDVLQNFIFTSGFSSRFISM